jgi:NADPH-dependent 2,4-dienoyl-CoA reductase/sulfur reductase-like enzyme
MNNGAQQLLVAEDNVYTIEDAAWGRGSLGDAWRVATWPEDPSADNFVVPCWSLRTHIPRTAS